MTTSTLNPLEIHELAIEAAIKAETEFKNQYGELAYCGFAWVEMFIDGRKPFAKTLLKAGVIKKGWGGGYIVWNPAGSGTQSMDVKEAGSQAYAQVFQNHGIRAYMGSRAD